MLPARCQPGGFSLVEIALAVGVIAFAFVALFGMLPLGLQTFRDAIDTNNEARIVQMFVSKVLATDFKNLKTTVDFGATGEVAYFDEEGTQIDTSTNPIASRASSRIYEAKVFVDDPAVPTLTNTLTYSANIVVVFANMSSPAAKEFGDQTANLAKLRTYLSNTKGKTGLKVRPLIVSKMDGVL
jgi:uncharacterized protein (TIGR02598 family)